MAAGILSWDLFSTCTREATDELRQELRELRGLKAALQKDRRVVRRLTKALLRRSRPAEVTVRFPRARSNRQVDMEGKANPNSEGRSITTSTLSDGCTPTPEPVSPRSIDVAVAQDVQAEPDCEQSPTRHRSPVEAGAGMSSFSRVLVFSTSLYRVQGFRVFVLLRVKRSLLLWIQV